jgi:hypothetical protein
MQRTELNSLVIGYLGADWWGSDALATAAELRRRGHLLIERHYEDFFPGRWRSVPLKIFRKLLRSEVIREYNKAVEELLLVDALQFLLVFKGMLLRAETLRLFRERGIACYCIYPDVSFHAHGDNIWECLPLYDAVFTTKSFHLEDPAVRAHTRQLIFVPHGFDPAVHRPVTVTEQLMKCYGCDASFVGAWSPKKEKLLTSLVSRIPEISLHIWGPLWHRAASVLRPFWKGRGAWGDELAAIYSCSRINLGLLSEAGAGTTCGDRTTARTWQIPACGAFQLHEWSSELCEAFEPEAEVGVFQDHTDLAARVVYWLEHEQERRRVAAAGYERALSNEYTYSRAVQAVLQHHRGSR